MNDADLINLATRVLLTAGELAAPILVTSLVIGFTVSLIQSATQVQEFTLAFVPKVIGCAVALIVCGNWMLSTMISFTTGLFKSLPSMLGS